MNSSFDESLFGHIKELRACLIKIFLTILLFTGVSFIFYESIFSLVKYPLQKESIPVFEIVSKKVENSSSTIKSFSLPKEALLNSLKIEGDVESIEPFVFQLAPSASLLWQEEKKDSNLLILSPLEGFQAIIKVCLWVGIFASCPIWLYFLFEFIMPALQPLEKLIIIPFFILSLIFTSLGLLFAYFVTIPIANQALFSFNETLGSNNWILSSYIDYSLILLLSTAFIFEVFAVIILLIHYGFLKAEHLENKRKQAILISFITAALLTPPDVLSQALLAIPMVFLYEAMIWYAKWLKWSRKAFISRKVE